MGESATGDELSGEVGFDMDGAKGVAVGARGGQVPVKHF